MKITNKYELPSTIVDALRSQQARYSKGDAWMSVTGLQRPPRMSVLTKQHWGSLSEDASDGVWKLFGSAIHEVLQEGESNSLIKEERLFMEIDGKIISGAIDVQEVSDFGIAITDWKMTKARNAQPDSYSLRGWTEQLNCYAELVEQNKEFPVYELSVCAIIRDHTPQQGERQKDYPPSPIHMVEIELWPQEKRLAFIKDRIAAHVEAEELFDVTGLLPPCTDEERWKRGDKWAVMPNTTSTKAYRIFGSEEEAKALAATKDKYVVEPRPSSPLRCERYCSAAPFCDQYQGELK
jgi:hypothetical protein